MGKATQASCKSKKEALKKSLLDDIIFGSIKKELCIAFEKLMHKKFQMSSMGELTFFLELQKSRLQAHQETQKPLLKDKDGEEVDVHMYRSMNGSLMYLTSSRPNIMFAVYAYARYQVNLKVSHLHVVKRIFRYLKGQPKLGLWYLKDSSFDLIAYTDSDYAGASLDRKSTTRDKVVHKELGDSLVRAATIASILEAECQETMGDTIAQTRVLDLEKTKTTQDNEIASLKRRVKKLKKKNRSRTHKLKRLYKVGLTARVESSTNEESLGKDASKQRRINAIDVDEKITLVSVQNVVEEMFDVNVLDGEDVFVAKQEVAANKENDEVNVVEEVVEVINTAKLITDAAQVSAAGNVVSIASDATTVSAATTTTDDDGDITRVG
ncbi:hypothetical protein Tco_0775068 [Tanacetum coccineum]